MKNQILFITFLFIFLQTAFCQSKSTGKEEKWISIFNGENLDGWTPKVTGYKSGENPLNGFRVEDGILKVDYRKFAAFNGRFGHLFYKDKLSSYILHIEYRFVGELLPDAPSYCIRNSGVMVCSQSPGSMDINENWPVSIEVQLLGSTDKLKQTTGIRNIVFRNIDVTQSIYNPGYSMSLIGGYDSQHTAENIIFDNFRLNGVKVTNADQLELYIKQAKDIRFK
jgi:hypothetical protein